MSTKKTKVFDELDNVLGNYAEGKATAEDVVMVAERVTRYCHEHPHPDAVFQNVAYNVPPLDDGRPKESDDKRLLEAGPSSFSLDDIKDCFELVKSGELSQDEFLSKYPKNSVGIIGSNQQRSLVIDISLFGPD